MRHFAIIFYGQLKDLYVGGALGSFFCQEGAVFTTNLKDNSIPQRTSLNKSHLYQVEEKKGCCYYFPKHRRNAPGHGLSLLFSAHSPTHLKHDPSGF